LAINYDELSKKVLALDSQVRFAGIANSKGELVAGGHKESIDGMLSSDEVKMSIHYALQKRELYTNLAYKIGHETSSITEYEKVAMISVPINSNELFMISTEPRADYLKIIDYVYSKLDPQKYIRDEIKAIEDEINELKNLKETKSKRKPVRKSAAKKKVVKRKPARKSAAKKKVVKRKPARKSAAKKKVVKRKPARKRSLY
jgi:hypothetical protein